MSGTAKRGIGQNMDPETLKIYNMKSPLPLDNYDIHLG